MSLGSCRSGSDPFSSGLPDILEVKKVLSTYEERLTEEQTRLEQKEADLKNKEKHIDAEVHKKEEESRRRVAAEEREVRKKLKADEDWLEGEKKDWEEEKERVKQTKVFEKVVTLDVGGTKYRTTLSTLTRYPDSMLGAMFSGRHNLPQQEDGSYFIDRDGEVFKYILMYLRDRDHCFDVFGDEDLHNPNARSSPPSILESQMLRNIAFEAKYFLIKELETSALIALNAGRGGAHGVSSVHRRLYVEQNVFSRRHTTTPDPKCYGLDYGQNVLQCSDYTDSELSHTHQCVSMRCKHSEASRLNMLLQGTDFKKKVTFESCDLSGVTFRNCYFQKGVSFEGCILHGTKFERVGGLVSHKIHFDPWQVAQADFEPELLQALKDNGCIY